MDTRRVSKDAVTFFSGTLLSRVSGLIRDVAMAMAFGDHPSVGAFMVAFRFSNLFRRLLGEGALQATLVPHFEGLRLKNDEAAYAFFRDLVFSLLLVVCLVVGATEGCLYFFGNGEVSFLSKLMTPSLVFISLYGLYLTFLQCHEKFFVASVAPAFCNITWIVGTLALRGWNPEKAMPILALLVTVGFALQWSITWPLTSNFLKRYPKQRVKLFSKEVRKMAAVGSIGLLGAGAMQISALIDALFARIADPKGPVYLWYALRLEQLPLALIGIACTSALIPKIARAIRSEDEEESKALLTFGSKQILTLLLPMTLGILFLSKPLVSMMYERGAFTSEAVEQTSHCLVAYGMGLIPAVFIILYTAIAYARNMHRLPAKLALISIFLNALLNAIFVFIFNLGALSIAIATSITTWINFLFLHKRVGLQRFEKGLVYELAISSLLGCALFMGIDKFAFTIPILEVSIKGSALLIGPLAVYAFQKVRKVR